MNPLPSDTQVREWIRYACFKNSVIALPIRVEWRNFTGKMGCANYGRMLIKLSKPIFARAELEEQRETVIHEACHIIARFKSGSLQRIMPHGYEWQTAMIKCGLEPRRCHEVSLAGINPFVFICPCGEHHVTKNKATRIRKNLGTEYAYFCKTCKAELTEKA